MFGIYFHWSYCLSKCIYCDFGSSIIDNKVDFEQLQSDYLECCKRQLYYFKSKIREQKQVSSIYFGGGTPSLLNASIINELIKSVKNDFDVLDDCEITLEANPTSSNEGKFYEFCNAGVNRLSIGVQSFSDKNLLFLGRKHNVKDAIKTIEIAKKIFPKYSFDLIYGLPNQTLEQWLVELKQALLQQPQHISLYTLIVDENTVLGKMVKNGIVIPKTEDEMSEFYDLTNSFITKNSHLKQYEVSNYSIQKYESCHNLIYWKSYDYIGIGAGAHGRLFYNDGYRYEIKNIFSPNLWKDDIINNKNNGLEIERKLTKKEQVEEILIMGLRTKYGINIVDIKNRFNINVFDFLDDNNLNEMINNDFLTYNEDDKILKLTYKGLKILDFVLQKIIK